MEDKLQDLRFFKVILDSIADGVFTVDKERRITSFNRVAERITRTTSANAVGKHCYEIFHSDICEKGCLLKDTMITGREVIDAPVNIIDSAGNQCPISISTSILRDDEGNVLGAVETFRDLSTIERLRKDLERTYSFEDIISKSPIMRKFFSILPDVAESESTVLIQGPSGSGKELFARAVHNLSPRKNKNYIIINCGTLPQQLFESELFGYVKGAFTDAKKDKAGKITAAEKGTVFFDEIGELPLSTQVKLLRLLHNREYEKLGSNKSISANIRVIAATNRNLQQLVAQGKFRDDLYFRLAVVKLDLPSLEERKEDIPYLIDHFIRQFNARKGKKILGVSPGVIEILMRHNFPGNVRELENIIEYGFVICHGRILDVEHLPNELLMSLQTKTTKFSNPLHAAINEESYIRELLQNHNGNQSVTAKAMNLHRTTLWRKLKRYEINPDEYKVTAEQ